jgi:hypothetical protein
MVYSDEIGRSAAGITTAPGHCIGVHSQ